MTLPLSLRQRRGAAISRRNRRSAARHLTAQPPSQTGNVVADLPNGHLQVSYGGTTVEATCVHLPGWEPRAGERVTLARVAGYLHVTGPVRGPAGPDGVRTIIDPT